MKRKKITALLLTGAMAMATLTGCGGDSKTSGQTDRNVEASNEAEDAGGEDADKEQGDPYTVAIQVVNISPELPDIEMVENAINEITVPAINCKVDIQNLFIGDLPTTTSMNIVGGEKMDIVALGLTQKLENVYDAGILMPLDDYLQYVPEYTELVKDYMMVGNIDGTQYALPVSPYGAHSTGCVYNKDMADTYGITLEDGITFDDLTEAFQVLKENGIYGTSMGQASSLQLQFFYNIELYGSNGSCGMIADPAVGTKIESVFGSDQFREFCNRMKEWTEAGYMPADSLTDTTTVQEYLKNEKLFCTFTNYDISQFGTWAAGNDFTIDIVQITDPVVSTSSLVENMWGLASNCENPQKAMEFLNYIYVNPDVANLLQYGIEGQHYTIVEGTEGVTTPQGSAAGQDGYMSGFTHYGDPTKIYAASPNTDNYADDVIAFNKDVPVSATLGYTFDVSNVSAEMGAVDNVIAEYLPRLQAGQNSDVDALLAEFSEKLTTAGYDDIIAENQKQLDEFLAGK